MIVTAEISYYPMTTSFDQPIDLFLKKLEQENIEVKVGTMSTLLTGEYKIVMDILTNSMRELMEDYPSVFTIKISNSCVIK